MASQSAPSSFIVGSHVWVEDPDDAWIEGEVTEVKGKDIKVNCKSGKTIVAKSSNVHPKDPEFPSCGVDDMTRLAYLHEPGVLQNLNCRYDINEIYTYTGNILIAVNPFRRLPHLYSNHMMEQYKGAAFGELSPHPFAVADAAYRNMIHEKISQAILVSGESGAGKTESTKSLMRYLAYMGGKVNKTEERSVEQKVLESNPVLEAFGNAKTVRNNNSSRFGKFVEIQFDEQGHISGAAIRTYLLERSRVCQVSDPERNYHCFYMLCAAPPELDGVDEFKEYVATKTAMDVVGISEAEQDAIFRVVAAILHLGNVEFVKGKEVDSSEPKDDKSRFHLKTAAELFKCNEKALEDSLVKRVMVTRDESITKSLDPVTAALSRDALAKIVYSKLFDWLVDKINVSIGQDPQSKLLIGVLDIYGFESFKTNSFEQFCINLTNEKLQQHFNQHVFKMEQEEYKKEEINWSYIDFIDNQDILDLIEKKPGGIIALLDEACMFPRSTHETFAQKLYQTFKDHKRFSKPKLSRTDFTIDHYAGEVTYQTDLFLDKNKDYVVAEHQALLHASECSFVSSLFPPPEETSKSSKFSSIGSSFKQQLQALLETLSATEPHYIRCVKPNNALKPAIFENKNVLQQLRCGGVMEAIRISCAGFPSRKTFNEFAARFSILAPEVFSKSKSGSYNEVTASKRILEKSNLTGYQIGKTKVFLRAGQMAELDALRAEVLAKAASLIQRKVRTYLAHKYYKLLRLSAIQIQALCRGVAARHLYEGMRREAASVNIQKYTRRFLARKAYKILYFSAISIQTGMRGMVARSELLFRRQTKAATIIQSRYRRFLARGHYLRLKKAAITTQCAWRARVARRELRKLKLAARETGALQEAKTKLEKEVEELTWRLQLEKRTRVDLEESKKQESAKFESTLKKMQLEFEESKKQENARFESTLQKMQLEFEESKNQESARYESTLQKMQLEFEESKKQESERFESTMHKKQLEFQELQLELQQTKELLEQETERLESTLNKKELELREAKELLVKENSRFESALEKMQLEFEGSKRQESARFESTLQMMQLELQQATELLEQESARFESTMHKKQLEFQEQQLELQQTKELLEQETARSESTMHKKELEFQELQLELQQTKELLEQESARVESTMNEKQLEFQEQQREFQEQQREFQKLQCEFQELQHEFQEQQHELQELQLELQETKELLVKEREAAKIIAEQVPVIKEIPVNDNELMNKPTAENEQLKVQETKDSLVEELNTEKSIAEQVPTVRENAAIDNESMNIPTAENEQLKVQETKESLVEECEAEKNNAEQVPVVQENPAIDNESMNKPVAENEQLKVQETKKTPVEEPEAEKNIAEQVPAVQENPANDNELMNKPTAENEQLKVLETKELPVEEREAEKNTAEQVPAVQENPPIENELMNKLAAEIEQPKDTKELLVEGSEAAKSIAEQVPAVQENPVSDNELMIKPTAENEQPKVQETKDLLVEEHEAAKNKPTSENEQPKETKELLVEKHEATKNIAEQITAIQDIPLIDSASMNKLTAENEQLKAMVSSLEQKINETERKYEESNKLSEERLKQATEAESKIIELKVEVQRLEEKILDSGSGGQKFQRSRSKIMSEVPSAPLENGDLAQVNSGPSKQLSREDSKLRRSQTEKQQQESVDGLLDCLAQNLGFSQDKPVAAFTIYKCLLHWKSFEAEKTNVFDRLIAMMGSALEDEGNTDHIVYWLSNTSSLLFLLQRTLKAVGAQKSPAAASFFARMTKSFRSSSANLQAGIVIQIEAKYPALLFKQQLSAYVEKIYGIVRDNLKKELSPLISRCIQPICQVPRTSKGTAFPTSEVQGYTSPASHWKAIIECLNRMMSILKENFVSPLFVQNIFTQTFAYINVKLFNSLLLRRECCTFSNGEYVKSGLAELEMWCAEEEEDFVGSAWDELKHTRQAVGFLVINQKSKMTYEEIANDLCNGLSVQQLYRVCTLYRDDKYNTQSVSHDVLSRMKQIMTDSEDDVTNSFLLEDDLSIPFTMEDINSSQRVKEYASVQAAEELMDDPDFQFLQE
ncbi:hypothetical protein V6N11_009549 [Hibiscus sabdariffa]|uniref:Uncharacterized protein n=1 Tax=Hibiscus sabdariffa TaxID=183260 RepID=A0ABR2P644_9ROSI